MKILATCQYGFPEPYPFLYPMEELVKKGHTVHAITGMPNYPMGKIYPGYSMFKEKDEVHEGIQITHVPLIPRKKNIVFRFLNYHSYPIFAKRRVMQLSGDYDVVFANQTSPVMMVEPAIAYAKKWNKKVAMYCMDLWPASLEVGGVSKNSFIYRYYHKISQRIYTNVDLILVTSKSFKDYFKDEFHIDENKIIYLPQYSVLEQSRVEAEQNKKTTDFVFAGNVGTAQNLQILVNAAEIVEKEMIRDNGREIYFHIVGDGQELENLKKIVKERKLKNVVFYGRRPLEEMPKFYAMADAMLVTLTPNKLVSLTLPAKVQSYMAAGKAILASANGEINQVLSESHVGYCAPADDVQGFVENIKKFIMDENRPEYGKNAIKFYEENFSKEKVISRLEKILEDLVSS